MQFLNFKTYNIKNKQLIIKNLQININIKIKRKTGKYNE